MKTTDINISIIFGFIKMFVSREIMEIAQEVGFIQRNDGKITAETFVKVFTIGLINIPDATLSQIAAKCEKM